MRYSDLWRSGRHYLYHPSVVTDLCLTQIAPENVSPVFSVSNGNGILRHSEEENSITGTEASIKAERFLQAHAGGIILEIVYSYHIQDEDDSYVKMADDALVGAREAGISGSFLVDYIPLPKHLPSELLIPIIVLLAS
ncbi:hypothetical protein L218DRAFT_1001198 [Marasmius fiardii PR-910]|nr:hypothetical protein L218DRAFT_1001198 [Marasmius fiardii PR-910]